MQTLEESYESAIADLSRWIVGETGCTVEEARQEAIARFDVMLDNVTAAIDKDILEQLILAGTIE